MRRRRERRGGNNEHIKEQKLSSLSPVERSGPIAADGVDAAADSVAAVAVKGEVGIVVAADDDSTGNDSKDVETEWLRLYQVTDLVTALDCPDDPVADNAAAAAVVVEQVSFRWDKSRMI